MIPVTQTKVSVFNSKGEHVVYGNCLAACIASLLEVPITEVPNVEVLYFLPGDETLPWFVLQKFLFAKGYDLYADDRYRVFHDSQFGVKEGKRMEYLQHCMNKYYLVTGKSPRGIDHITIWKDGKMVHDPHPTKEGLLELTAFEVLEMLPNIDF